jgi:hypothetical protein
VNQSSTRTPNVSATWRNPISIVAFGATAVAIAIAGLAQPPASHAEKVWDIGAFDSCVAAANDRYISGKTDNDTWGDEIRFCCERSGGEWSQTQGCTAPPATFQTQPQTPGSVRAPVPSKAALP